ncbi:MAG: outer membrane beta-barrel protein [Pseudomonadota bacterium]
MNHKLLALSLVAAVLLPMAASAESGFFIHAAVGQSELSDDFDGFAVDDDSTAWRLSAGWRLNDYLAFEGGYHNFGRFEQDFNVDGAPVRVSLKADGFTLGGVGSIPVSERFDVFGRVGAFFWDGDADLNGVTQATPEDTNLYLGLGVRFDLNERFSITGDGSRYDLDGTTGTVFSIGADLRF